MKARTSVVRFAADAMLGRLARWLRILGFDTVLFSPKTSDEEVTKKSKGRILLTRDKKLARAKNALYVKSHHLEEQLKEVFCYLHFRSGFPRRTRCPLCNGPLTKVTRPRTVPAKVRSHIFWRCRRCRKIYWRGSHWKKIERVSAGLRVPH